ncbi:MAG: SpoIIE family protein phosphatase [Anaerolineales bacterium]|nr:SpoIIE family protein phosphatase [Anaerolineales bacterium]
MSQPTGERLATLYRISQTFNSSLDLDEVLNRVMDEVIRVTNAERGFLMLRDSDGDLTFKVARGLDHQTIESPEFEVSRSVVNRVANEVRSILTSDAQSDEWLSSRLSVRGLKLRALLCVPLLLKDTCIGVVYVDNRLQAGIFDKQDIELLEGIAASAAIAIENARLYQVAVEKGRLERELQVAHEVQSNLIPRQTPDLPGWDFATWWQPARQVSGDFYDFIPLSEGHLGLVIGDVTDKGMPAALFMANTRSIIRAIVARPLPPSQAITTANQLICADSSKGMFVSLFYAQLDPISGVLTYVNAGHNPPLHFCYEEDSFEELKLTGMPLGIEREEDYGERSTQLDVGDYLLLYTDGVTEATNERLQLFGKEELLAILSENRKATASDIHTILRTAITEFLDSSPPMDDISLTIIRRTGT